MSQYVNDLYANILRQLTLFSAFSAVAVVIAALGLLAFGFFEIIEATARRATAVKPQGPRPSHLHDLP